MLKLTYKYKNKMMDSVTVIGDPIGIRDLYQTLTRCTDNLELSVTNLNGMKLTYKELMTTPHAWATQLSSLEG